MTAASGLEMRAAALRSGGAALLGPVTLALPGGGITVVMGANGAGKSLFLRLAHGLIAPAAGTVHWDGREARATMTARGFVFQAPPLLRRSVAANIGFPLVAQGLPRRAVAARVAAALAQVRLGAEAGTPAARLSGGERQRMALARALVTEPGALLLDEPSASLDPASTAELEELIRAVAAQQVTVLMSTHDIGQARRMADRVLFFAGGQLVEQGPAAAFFDAPRTAAARDYLAGRLAGLSGSGAA